MIVYFVISLNFIVNVIIIVFAAWVVLQCYKIKNLAVKIKKEMTEIEKIISDEVNEVEVKEGKTECGIMCERLIGIAVMGKSKEYLGKNITS